MADFHATIFWLAFPDSQPTHAVKLSPLRWGAEAIGGPSSAEIRVSGTEMALAEVSRMLGATALIHNELGTPVFWGYVHETGLSKGSLTATLSLDEVYNRVAVAYTVRGANGAETRQTTDWADWPNNTYYGIRELLATLNEGDETAATAQRDRLLYQHARIMPQFSSAGGASDIELTLYCRGHWERLAAQYLRRPEGLVEHSAAKRGQQAIGGYYTNTTISFVTGEGESDDIRDSANGLGALTVGTAFWVSGAANSPNNGNFSTAHFDNAGHIETTQSTLVMEAAGAAVTLAVDEVRATQVAGSFVAPASFEVRKLAARVMSVGAPADSLRFAIYSDGGGSPGSMIVGVTLAGSSIGPTDAWVELWPVPGTFLTAGTTYWFVVERTGGTSLAGYYIVGLDETLGYAGGSLRLRVGGSWVARTPDADLPFRVLGLEDTALQIATAIEMADSDGIYSAVQQVSSGIETWQYRAGDRTIQDEILELMELGTNDGGRMMVQVTPDRYALVYKMPTTVPADAVRPVLLEDGTLGDMEPGVIPAGRWVRLGSQAMMDAIGQDMFFCERGEYDAETGEISLEAEGTVSAWRAVGWRGR